jgi:bifunctional UDP-N-acetylglucosamine pyrophosphorylase/glucosamine-1-phosphate N-acetyltransferase
MRSDLPKVLHRLGGRPLLAHVLDTARELGAENLRRLRPWRRGVREALDAADVIWVGRSPSSAPATPSCRH